MNTIDIAMKAIRNILVSINGLPGSVNSLLKIIFTSLRSFTRKKIQAKLTMAKVVIQRRRFAIENPSETFLILSPYIIRSITMQAPCNAPHITKAYAAPCHSPLIVNTTIVLSTQRALLHRLPPSGK